MSLKITKRDGSVVYYNINNIKNAITSAFKHTNVECTNYDDIINTIDVKLKTEASSNDFIYNIEKVQDIVENTLMDYKYYDVAKHYISYRNERTNKRKFTSYVDKIPDDVKTSFGMLGYITYKRTYARSLNDDSETTEEYRDTILRILNGCQTQLKVNFTNEELKNAYYYLMSLKCSVAGRFLWQLGTETVDKLGIMSLQNCAFVKIDEPIKPFLWIFDVLMLGTGVGFNVQKDNISKLPKVIDKDITITRQDTKDADFIIPDSREGWVSLLEKVLEAYFFKGNSFTYSTVLIRSAGTKIKGFGGVASGPEDLVKGIKNIQTILNKKKGDYLNSVDCLDIVNIIASIVVAGNVRRCLPIGSKVHTRKGLIKIEDIIVGDEALTTEGYCKISAVFEQGTQKLLRINTDNGYFRCTKNHKMAIYNSNSNYTWKNAGELKKDDILINPNSLIEGNSEIKLPPAMNATRRDRINIPNLHTEISWFFGYFYGNGEVFYDKIVVYFNDEDLLNRTIDTINKFNSNIRIVIDIDRNNNNYKIEVYSHNLSNYLGTYAKNISDIPYFIDETTASNRFAYIEGVINSRLATTSENNIITIKDNNLNKWSRSFQTLCYSCNVQSQLITLKQSQVVNINNYNLYNNINNINATTSKIINIVEDCEEQTYDITVDTKHEFFCDGYLTHNSALICLGDCDDVDYLNAKRWDLGNIPNWRCMSNNSVVCDDISKLLPEFWNGYNGGGEPYGLINIELSKKIGRIKDGEKYPDPLVEGYNPCSEQSLANYETCCLSEIFLPNITSFEELKDVATTVYRICKHSLLLKCHHEKTEEIVHHNLRMGIGMTGILQSTKEQRDWLSPLYEYLREYDDNYSKKIGTNTSVKLTTVKPSGTLSLLAGVTPGVHAGIYQYFIRRIRISSSNHNLINICRKNGYFIEYQKNFDGTDDKNTMVIEFPCCYPEGTILAKDLSAVDQLNTIKELQTDWSDNAVSNTVYFRLHELDDIKTWLHVNYKNNVKSCSFLLHNDHGFKQAPYEEITKEKYDELLAKVKPITSGNINQATENELGSECAGGVCPIR
jgi:hypothetical protein